MPLPRGFCAAPWAEGVVRIDGLVHPCCRLDDTVGSTADATLTAIWRDAPYREFRRQISGGKAPSSTCEACFADGKATTLFKLFDADLALHWETFARACATATQPLPLPLCKAMTRFHDTVRIARTHGASSRHCRTFLRLAARHRHMPIPAEGRRSLRRLAAIARTCIDYLEASLQPRRVAPLRQVNLVAVCNARCVHCIGLYTGEIQRGLPVGERRIKRMAAPDHERAFERAADISGFFMNGSEFLLHREWRDLVRRFARARTMLSLATNGMLLDREASTLLVESGVLRDINFSFDGASAGVVERIRAGVRHDVLLRNLGDFLDVLAASRKRLTVSLSMVLLKDNVHEAPSLVDLAAAVRGDRALDIHVSFQLLNPASDPGYAQFAAAQRTDLADPGTRALLTEAARRGDDQGVPTRYSYRGSLRDALGPA